jgi:hypothetical protein
VDVHRYAGNEWIYDDFPCAVPAFNELPAGQGSGSGAVQKRSVAVRDVTYYIYCRNTVSWWQMKSPTASHEIADVTGTNAPVNYIIALEYSRVPG